MNQAAGTEELVAASLGIHGSNDAILAGMKALDDRMRMMEDFVLARAKRRREDMDEAIRATAAPQPQPKPVQTSADDVRALREYAYTLVALDPERAAAVLEREWQDEAGRKRIARVLALLDSADVGPVLDHLSVERTREVLLERLKVVRGD